MSLAYSPVILISANVEWRIIKRLLTPLKVYQSPFGEWFPHTIWTEGTLWQTLFFHTGWGKIGAAASTQYVIDYWEPSFLINLGTCGGFAGAVEKGTIIMPTRTVVYDIYEQMGDAAEHLTHYAVDLDLSWIHPPYPQDVLQTVLVSGDRDIFPEDIPYLRETFGAVAADWESGAIAWVARRNEVPVLILRGVSDLVGPEGGEAYDRLDVFEAGAERVLRSLIDHLPKWLDRVDPSLHSYRHVPLAELNLSSRTANALRRAGYETVEDLQRSSEEDLLRVRQFGRKALQEVKEALAAIGLSLSPESWGERRPQRQRIPAPPDTPRAARSEEYAHTPVYPALEDDPTDIHVLALPDYVEQALRKGGIRTVGELASRSPYALFRVLRSMGEIVRIRHVLQDYEQMSRIQTSTLSGLAEWWLAPLQDRYREILELRYGRDRRPQTLEAIGQRLGVSRQRVLQLLQKIHRYLNVPSVRQRIRSLDEEIRALFEEHGGTLDEETLASFLSSKYPEASPALVHWFTRMWLDVTPWVTKEGPSRWKLDLI